jgi:hypothetical protein
MIHTIQASVGQGAEVGGQAAGCLHLGSPEDMEGYLRDITDRVTGERLAPFLTVESQAPGDLQNDGGQVRCAQRSLRKDKHEVEEYSNLDGGAGVTARRLLVVDELRALDATTRTLIQKHSHAELRTYLGDFATAGAMFAALPLFFGGASQEQQLNVKALMRGAEYKYGKEGQGARGLHMLLIALAKRLRAAGGSIDDAEVMQMIIDKFRLKSDGTDLYNFTSQSLLKDLNNNVLTLPSLRTEMIGAEQRIEKLMSEDNLEIKADGAAMATSAPAPVPTLTMAMVTKAVAQGLRTGNGGGGGGGRGVCFNHRDKGTCRFGENCRFLH